MGAFHLIHHSAGDGRNLLAARLDAGFRRQGFVPAATLASRHWRLGFYDRPAASPALPRPAPATRHADAEGNEILCAGTLFYGQHFGVPALASLLADTLAGRVDQEVLWGSFAAVVVSGGDVKVFTDRTGTLHLFEALGGAVLSTSFLALAEALPGVTTDEDAAYDYVFQGAPYGGATPVREIRLVPGTQMRVMGRNLENRCLPPLHRSLDPVPRNLDDAARRCLELLDRRFAAVAAGFGDNVDTALSGGFDSRLLLALLRRAGLRPRLHVYGSVRDPDVTVARIIADGEGIDLVHEEKGCRPLPDADALAEIVARNLHAFDGYACDGLIDDGSDLAARLRRAEHGGLMLNGGGGEVLRDFFHLPDRPLGARTLIESFFCQFVPPRRARFDVRRYVERLADQLSSDLGCGDRLSRTDAEAAYPLFRCRYWMGRNNSVNNRLGFAVTPYVEPGLVREALTIPMGFKIHGRLQARLIQLCDPRLAAYHSAYGHPFDRPPSLRRQAGEFLLRHCPASLRRKRYLQRHRRPIALPPLLSPERLARVLPGDFEMVRRWFDVEAPADPGQYRRLLSLEYLYRHLDAGSATR